MNYNTNYAEKLMEEQDNWFIELGMPGMTKDDIEIKVANDEVIVTRDYCTYRMIIPENSNTKNISAVLNRGILTITIPKRDKDVLIEIVEE